MDPGWAVAEFNTADFQTPGALPDYAMAYRALREMYNYGARFISPMAWNGCDGRDSARPGYISYTAWRNTALEEAMRDFALSHAFLPLGARLWTFGSPRHADADGWVAANTARLVAGNGYLDLNCAGDSAVLISPSPLALARAETDLLVLGVASDAIESLGVEARTRFGVWMSIASRRAASECEHTSAGISVPLDWPAALECAEQLRIALTPAAAKDAIRIAHIALYPWAAPA